jgi:hypothetical protein
MFVSVTGSMIGGAGFPVATPIVFGASGVALVLALVVGIAACALVVASRLAPRARSAARPQRSRHAGGLALVAGRAVAR